MKIGTVLTATDLNPLYLDFIPIFIKSWTTLFPEIDVIIVLVANDIHTYLNEYKKYIHIQHPIENIHTAFHAQCIRLLYPQLVSRNEGILITDIDMLPMNRYYYEEPIKNISNNSFISYRDVCLPSEISICYNIAIPSVWNDIFRNETIEKWYADIVYDGNHGGFGWNTDQLILLKKFNEFNGEKIILNDYITKFNRLDRIYDEHFTNKDILRDKIIKGDYSDYHCIRPYKNNKDINNFIVESLLYQKTNMNNNSKTNKQSRNNSFIWSNKFK